MNSEALEKVTIIPKIWLEDTCQDKGNVNRYNIFLWNNSLTADKKSHTRETTRSRRTQPDVGPSTRTTRSRKAQRGNGQNPGKRDEELNHGGAQSVRERTYETEIRCLRRRLEEAQHGNAELEREAASARAAQGTNTQNQPEHGVRRPRGSQTWRQEKTWEEQPRENETPPENQDEQPDGRQPETDEQEIPHENEEDVGTQPREQRSRARSHQHSSQTHRARTRTYPDGGNTTNCSREERIEHEEASVTSRRSRTHSRSTQRGESTQRAND
ncbi:uncharacterized protein LOC133030090 [Cannabis sativa]|uniref:uncharacterized protein LOC133030090 n=1 Tax=Cannabis sativa TaxID=3483 RepID=UPI0029C9EE4D|nr:uncharacterized protein LOC133030090 [Cannabis sativa]